MRCGAGGFHDVVEQSIQLVELASLQDLPGVSAIWGICFDELHQPFVVRMPRLPFIWETRLVALPKVDEELRHVPPEGIDVHLVAWFGEAGPMRPERVHHLVHDPIRLAVADFHIPADFVAEPSIIFAFPFDVDVVVYPLLGRIGKPVDLANFTNSGLDPWVVAGRQRPGPVARDYVFVPTRELGCGGWLAVEVSCLDRDVVPRIGFESVERSAPAFAPLGNLYRASISLDCDLIFRVVGIELVDYGHLEAVPVCACLLGKAWRVRQCRNHSLRGNAPTVASFNDKPVPIRSVRVESGVLVGSCVGAERRSQLIASLQVVSMQRELGRIVEVQFPRHKYLRW